ncbi:MAG: Fis family transcriptional regulator [Bdellovibrionaceae bacterium]|nr:Fis family transcriptional regulator [Pseudobdellovibrionaceae bacterium]|tara:strand:+ start:21110 stop:22501 length:1392 start_codon:yes stop_codon:yes gene_type:complete
MKVLIATDKQDALSKTDQVFSETIEVVLAANPPTAFKKFDEESFDLVFWEFKFLGSSVDAAAEQYKNIKSKRPGVQLVVLADNDNIRDVIELIKLGAVDYLTHPVDMAEWKLLTERNIVQERRQAELDSLRDLFWRSDDYDLVSTKNPKMKRIYDMIKEVAPTNSIVLLNGETGVGKGVMAKLIHRHSERKDRQFIHVHCGAISESLIESELFGHEKGAFTSAIKRKLGKFELANQGTIFLDEISTLSAAAQVKLLQVLQDSIFQRVGGESDIKVNVRVIAATNENLKDLVEQNKFRKDLYYRLNVFPVDVPALRDRAEDIESLILTLLEKLSSEHSKKINGIEESSLLALKSYNWPGNIRELENLVERAFILERSHQLSSGSFPMEIFEAVDKQSILAIDTELSLASARARNSEVFEKQYLVELLSETEGKINLTAQRAGISERQLNNLMKKHQIFKEDFKS